VVRIVIQRTDRDARPERPERPERLEPHTAPPGRPHAEPFAEPYAEQYERPVTAPAPYTRSPYARAVRARQGPPVSQTQPLPLPLPEQLHPRPPRRRLPRFLPRVPRWAKWTTVFLLVTLVFRRAAAWLAIGALSAALHLIGINVQLPHIKFGWPWSSISSGTTTNVVVGPLVLQKIEGISRPALGTETFNFVFTRTVSKNVLMWPCWYSATFYAVGRASATVDLNPGPAWWKPATGHYQLRVLQKATPGTPGKLAITMALPIPQLPQSVHDITVDNTLSKPISTDHSWTYPGLGCGTLIRPQFAQSVLYAQAQNEAFYQATHDQSVIKPLMATTENEAVQMVRDNFIQPTVNALGYTLTSFSIRWVVPPLVIPR
jgi:hypothetical protein